MDEARYDEAELALDQALNRCPDDQRRIPLSIKGHICGARGDHQHAAEWYQRVIEANPKHVSGYIHLGGSLAIQGRLREAEEVHRRATENCYEGCLDEAFVNLGLVLRAQERFEEAAECLREAIRLDPEYRVARKALRDVELMSQDAKASLVRAPDVMTHEDVRSTGELPRMSENAPRKVLYEQLKQASDADLPGLTILLARRYLADHPEDWPAWGWLGNALQSLGCYDEAEQALARVLDLFPEDRRFIPMINLGRLAVAAERLRWGGRLVQAGHRGRAEERLGLHLHGGRILAPGSPSRSRTGPPGGDRDVLRRRSLRSLPESRIDPARPGTP